MSATVTIDTTSAPGSWARALRHRDQVAGYRDAQSLRGDSERVAVHAERIAR